MGYTNEFFLKCKGRGKKDKSVRRGSGANVVRASLDSFGGVVSPLTPASSAFRFPEPLECDFPMADGVLGVFKTDTVGIVGVDL